MPQDPSSAQQCDLCGALASQPELEKDGGLYRRCVDCGFVWSDPRTICADPVAETATRLEDYSRKQYAAAKQKHYRRMARSFLRYRQTGRLMEIGPNTGGFLYAAGQLGWQAEGVEPSEPCAAFGRDHYAVEVTTGFFEEADLAAGAFDVVYSNAVLEHITAPSCAFAKAFEILRPGGLFYGITVNYDSYTRELLGSDWKLLCPLNHVSLYTPDVLAEFCRKAGFADIKIRSNGVRSGRSNGNPLSALVSKSRKACLSTASRFTLKGDRLVVTAFRPS